MAMHNIVIDMIFICIASTQLHFILILLIFFFQNSPWTEDPYKDAAEKNALGGLSLDGFLSEACIFICALSAYT